MGTLILKDKKYFIKAFKAFSQRGQVTFEIQRDLMMISTLNAPYLYIMFSNDIYSLDVPVEFTVEADEIIKNLELIDSNVILLRESLRIVKFVNFQPDYNDEGLFDSEKYDTFDQCNYSFVDIPFANPIKSFYCLHKNFSTKFLLKKDVLKIMLNGPVKYQNSEKLILKKIGLGSEEIMEIDVDYLANGFLDFSCSNTWLSLVNTFYDLVDTVLFGFNDSFMTVKFILKNYKNTYIEIQIQEMEYLTRSAGPAQIF